MKRIRPIVLVADDESDIRMLIARALALAEVDMIEAADGEEAIELARTRKPNLVLLDINMPRRDGISACAALRALPEWRDVPIVMVTSLDDIETIKHAYDAGATDFIVKPFNRTVLAQRVRHLLRAARAFEEVRESQLRLEQAQRIAQLGHWEWDIESDTITYSAEANRIFGVPPEATFTSKQVLGSVHRDDVARMEEVRDAAVKFARPYALEHRIVRPGGEVRILDHRGEARLDESGQAVRLFGTVRDITEQVQAQERIRYLAYHDSLTGLPNRAMLREELVRAVEIAGKAKNPLAILSLDLDRFKRINDSFGHQTADRLLAEIARRLQDSVRGNDLLGPNPQKREHDLVARLGEDGYAILIHINHSHVHALAKVASRILEIVRHPLRIAEQEVFPTASVGIAVYPFDGEDVDTLLKNADAAMFHAKGQGRDVYQFYSKSMNESAAAKLALETELRRAIERQELSIVYQPKLDLHSNRIVGAEALVRYRTADLPAVSAGQLVAVAEEMGMIHGLGEFVMRGAARQTKTWLERGYPGVKVSVNLSPVQFRKGDELVQLVRNVLQETQLAPDCFELEVTESAVMHNEQEAIEIMRKLSELGVSLSIDDFGVGYSSLGYLARFPIDCLKIDRSFIHHLPDSHDEAVVTRGIISMAKALELITVAEGVDSAAQMQFLRTNGCDQVQGYVLSEPVPAEQFEQMFLHRDGNALTR